MKKYWYTLKEAAEIAGLTLKKLEAHKEWQPLGGQHEATQFGQKVWSYRTVENWLKLSDQQQKVSIAIIKREKSGFEDREKV